MKPEHGTWGIVVITRDRPGYLREFLPSLVELARAGEGCRGIVVVDDSGKAESRKENGALCGQTTCFHLTEPDQRLLFAAHFDPEDVTLFARPLGEASWNVGSSRNTGSLFWLAQAGNRPDTLVFLDDDLETVPGHERWLCELAATSYRNHALTGAPLVGMPDEACTWRVQRSVLKNLDQPVPDSVRWTAYPISGGCMSIPSAVAARHPFSQVYNEDYFLFYELESIGTLSLVLPAELSVKHRVTLRPITVEKLRQEAVGEISDRALTSAPRRDRTMDWLVEHWDAWRRERDAYAEETRQLAELCMRSPSQEDSVHVPALVAVAGWLTGLEIDLRPFADHRRARAAWAARLSANCHAGDVRANQGNAD